ncbi:zinc ribbon domain-containing protein, partial [Lamprobacter modestohalophilus]|uniref:zinc ribbon domain-containing protein n=1 Tax=Lamprobacter modestohalophilus TaxID=1064514 RepID=UPI002ADEEAE4
DCPECDAVVPLAVMECPLCGYVWERAAQDVERLSDFAMSEIDLLKRSHFRWCDLFGADDTLMATGFNAWGGLFWLDGHWYAVGGAKGQRPHLLAVGERTVCLAKADDWLNEHESEDSAHKSRRWLNQPATDKQLQYLPPAMRTDFGLSRYQAAVQLSFQFNKRAIRRLVQAASRDHARAWQEAA